MHTGRSVAVTLALAALLAIGAGRAEADRFRCHVHVMDSLSRPVPDATVSCGGVALAWDESSQTFIGLGERAPAPEAEVRVSHPRFLPYAHSVGANHGGVTSAAVWLPRRGELTVPNGVVDIPFVVERDHLLITIDRYDRAVPRMRPRADVLAELAPLFAAYGLVVARSHAVADRRDKFPEQCGSPDDEVVLARADGKPFSPTHVPALAALRAEPRVRTAGPLVRSNPWTSGEKSLGHRIHVYSLPHDVDLEPFARRHRGTWDPATRMLTLPPSTGLAAAGIATAIGRAYPGAMAELDMFAKVCRG